MAFDFPSSPTVGQIFSPAGGPAYIWDGAAWKISSGSGYGIASDQPPANPIAGQLWWESDSGRLYIYFNDGNSSQWVQISGPLSPSGVVKLAEGSGTSTGQTLFSMAIPAGYKALDIHLIDLVPSVTQTLWMQFSWDGGATWPQAATEYTYSYISYGGTATGAVNWAYGSAAGGYLIPTLGTGSAKKANARIWMPLNDGYQTYQSQADYWNGSGHLTLPCTVFAALKSTPPTHLRVACSAGTVAGKWQVNGVK